MKYSILISFTCLIGLVACKKEDIPKKADIVDMSVCLNNTKSNQTDSPCLTVETINNSYFQFAHTGSETSCESELITISYRISHDTILIEEKDEGPYAYCFCPRNISYVLGPFPNNEYVIQVVESQSSYQRDTFTINYQKAINFKETKCYE